MAQVKHSEAEFQDFKERYTLIAQCDPTQAASDAALWRFLRAAPTVDQAFKNIIKTNNWRREMKVDEITATDPFIQQCLTEQKAMVLPLRDCVGRPVVYFPACRHSGADRDLEQMERFMVYILETATRKCHEDVSDTIAVVFDLRNFSMLCMDYDLVKKLIWLLTRHYPERLGVCLIINSSTVFSSCWAIIKNWLDARTLEKIKFVGSDVELASFLHPDILPKIDYGDGDSG